jgi:hypothetical protein
MMSVASRCSSDAKNDRAARWYESYGALPRLDAPLSSCCRIATAANALKRGHYAVSLRGRPGLRGTQRERRPMRDEVYHTTSSDGKRTTRKSVDCEE